MNLGEKIKLLRIQKGMNQKQLAEKCQISASYLCDIEKGRFNGSLNVLQCIAKSLGVELVDLFKTEV